jgi:enoyl-CoA hydratase/carnithine racemase
MTAHHIKLEKTEDGIAILSIDRAEKRNAMTYAMLFAFIEKVREVSVDDSVRVLIVTGAGGTFCAGTDLADLSTIPGETRGVRGEAHEGDVWWPLVACPKPVIGAIDGFAVGMGAEFSSQCDVRIVTNRARFAWNFRAPRPCAGHRRGQLDPAAPYRAFAAPCGCSIPAASSRRRRQKRSAMPTRSWRRTR